MVGTRNIVLSQNGPADWTRDERRVVEILTTIVILKRREDEQDFDANDLVDALHVIRELAIDAERILTQLGIEVVDPGR
ncbi:MAG: hypothetical protein AB7N65_21480 [Vicinamibacterales bacterium]